MTSQEVGLATVISNIAAALEAEEYGIAETILMPALDQFPHLPQLWFHAGNMFFGLDKMALSVISYEKALDLEPIAPGYGNLGAAYRRLGDRDRAVEVLTQATELDPTEAAVWSNMAACYVNEGEPEKGLEYVEKSLELKPGFARAEWNGALMYLESGNYARGFDLYRAGLGKDRINKIYTRPDNSLVPYLPADLSELQYFHHKEAGTWEPHSLIVYGEQGIGDELMMASMLNDAQEDWNITFDCHPRLVELYRRKWPHLDIHDTRKVDDVDWVTDQEFCISVADLGAIYRRQRDTFTLAWKKHAPYYSADDDEVKQYRLMLEALAEGRKIIGLATRGGVIKTNRFYRTIEPKTLEPLLTDDRYMFVSLDYENVDPMIEHINEKYGDETIYGFRGVTHHFNYARTAALVKATDAVVTVCQSLFHLSASMDHPTLCLVPDRPAWRYGLAGKKAYWYPGKKTRMFRQKRDESWEDPVQRLAEYIEVILGARK